MAKTELAQQTDRGRPAQYKQPSRKGKKSWRKNIDLSATEAALEDIREQERAVGAPAYTQANDQLFVEDRRGQETQLARQAREKRKLKSQEILEARSAVPAIHQRARSAFQLDTQTSAGKANAAGLPAKVKRRLRILASRPHEGQEGQSEIGSAGKLQSDAVLAEKRDLWATEPAQPANEWRPRSLAHEPLAPAKNAPAIAKPHAGTSYNPDFEDHEELLQRAMESAVADEEEEQRTAALRKQWRNVQDTGSDTVRGMTVDLPIDDADDASDEPAENDDGDDVRTKMPGRKSAAQRRREARAKKQQRLAEQRRKQRQERALVSQLPAHLKAQRQRMRARQALVEERRARKLARMQAEGIAGFRVGKHVVPKQHVDVQTGDELSESLRQLKPEGNLFYDRFQNLQARGLLEARKPVVPSRRYKLREYDRHSFKRDD
ncbi:hypothetical protein CBS14141_002425 [Malassezia furfur]|nr:hypothetical protein CBS14141_002425 [Malassezia furfur]